LFVVFIKYAYPEKGSAKTSTANLVRGRHYGYAYFIEI